MSFRQSDKAKLNVLCVFNILPAHLYGHLVFVHIFEVPFLWTFLMFRPLPSS